MKENLKTFTKNLSNYSLSILRKLIHFRYNNPLSLNYKYMQDKTQIQYCIVLWFMT